VGDAGELKILGRKNRLVACGRIFFERIMNGLDDLDVDITHAGEILGALKSIGSEQLEEVFGFEHCCPWRQTNG
ncbi:hypothetical protein, partial [Eubacterium callanderi]|uniref:hypothetical protein n=1 Tax=Eubacterium callanderi TaxID=53442 RepID=UPI0021091108